MDALSDKKARAGHAAVELVLPNSIVGLGTGSTANFAIKRLAEKIKSGELVNIKCVSTSTQTAMLAQSLGLELLDMRKIMTIDITIDGADEIDPLLNLIKGGGGALLREKIVAQASQVVVIVADDEKLSQTLGTKWALPVEVFKMAVSSEKKYLEQIGANVTLRKNDACKVFVTDEGNYILDAKFEPIQKPAELADKLDRRAGIASHGLFIGLTKRVILATDDGLTYLP